MSNHRINPEERVKRVIFTLTPTNLSQIDEMTHNGNRSAFVRECIESVYAQLKARELAKETK